MGCRCGQLPRCTQRAAHTVHSTIEERIRQVRDLSQRYIPFLRPHVPDPRIVRMVQQDAAKFRLLTEYMLSALPEPEQREVIRSYPQSIREYVALDRRNSNHDSTQ